MRVMLVISQLAPGGAEQQLYYLTKHIPAERCVVVTRKDDPPAYWAQRFADEGIPFKEIPRRGPIDPFRLAALVRHIRDERPDIVHVFSDDLTALYVMLATRLSAHPRLVVSVQTQPSRYPRWLRRLQRHLIYPATQAVIVNTQSAIAFMRQDQLAPASILHYLPNGLDFTRFEHLEASPWPEGLPPEWRDHPIIGTVANATPVKNPPLLMRVMRQVLQAHPEARFVHIGDGPLLSWMRQEAQAHHIADKVRFLGRRGDVPQLLHRMSLFMMTSDHEGLSNAAMEAMAAGLPCVLTDVGDCNLLVTPGSNGYLAPAGDEVALVDALLTLLNDASLRQRMGRASLEAIQPYGLDRMVNHYLSIYRHVMADSASAGPLKG